MRHMFLRVWAELNTRQKHAPATHVYRDRPSDINLVAGNQYIAVMTNEPNGGSLGGNDPIFGGLGYAEGTEFVGFTETPPSASRAHTLSSAALFSTQRNWKCSGPAAQPASASSI
jgi:hypothetical protein